MQTASSNCPIREIEKKKVTLLAQQILQLVSEWSYGTAVLPEASKFICTGESKKQFVNHSEIIHKSSIFPWLCCLAVYSRLITLC